LDENADVREIANTRTKKQPEYLNRKRLAIGDMRAAGFGAPRRGKAGKQMKLIPCARTSYLLFLSATLVASAQRWRGDGLVPFPDQSGSDIRELKIYGRRQPDS
jgi:hypothetical protein